MKIKKAKQLSINESEFIVPSASKQVKMRKYENCSWPYVMSAPFMWLIVGYVMLKKKIYSLLGLSKPKINTFFFDGLGKNSRKVKEYAASWKALDIVYNHPFPYNLDIGTILDEFYWNSLNCQALRNRRKLIKEELRKILFKLKGENVKLMSLACGSGEVIIELVIELKKAGIKLEALLIDIDDEAIERAEELIKKYGLEKDVQTRKGDVNDVEIIANDFKPNIIEMMGFIDYLNQEQAIEITKKIRGSLTEGGYFITCNINSNIEKLFLTWVIDWPMNYRNPEELSDVAKMADFKNYCLIYEPLNIHGIIIARK